MIPVSKYADDTSFCYQCDDINQLNKAINKDPNKFDISLQANKLSMTFTKTHSMLVMSKQKHNILKSWNDVLELKI